MRKFSTFSFKKKLIFLYYIILSNVKLWIIKQETMFNLIFSDILFSCSYDVHIYYYLKKIIVNFLSRKYHYDHVFKPFSIYEGYLYKVFVSKFFNLGQF